jgi:hypothetical protein
MPQGAVSGLVFLFPFQLSLLLGVQLGLFSLLSLALVFATFVSHDGLPLIKRLVILPQQAQLQVAPYQVPGSFYLGGDCSWSITVRIPATLRTAFMIGVR